MTSRDVAEIRAALKAYQRERRDEEIRRGARRPRTQREDVIWREGLRERFGIGDEDDSTGESP